MANIRYTGEIVQDGGGFAVKVQVTLPSQAEAQQFGEFLHNAIARHIESRGGKLTKSQPALEVPGSLALN